MRLKNIFLSLALLTLFFGVNAQRTTPAKPIKPLPVKAPKLIAAIGGFKDTMNITVKEAENIIGLPLTITDAKGVGYEVSSYQFLYRQIITSEDEQTGRPYSSSSIKSSLFKVSPLPPLWVNTVKERLRAGEEFIFFDIIGRNAKGQVFYAPTIKLTLK